MLRTMVYRESEFLPEDVAVLMQSRANERVGEHGLLLNEAMNPANRGRFKPGRVPDYASQSLKAYKKSLAAQFPNDDPDGFRYFVELDD